MHPAMFDCVTYLQTHLSEISTDPLQQACVQAEALRHAAKMGAKAATKAGYFGMVTGFTTLIGAALGAWALFRSSTAAAKRDRKLMANLQAAAFFAEIDCFCALIIEESLSERLRLAASLLNHDEAAARARASFDPTIKHGSLFGSRLRFHPGTDWLLAYPREPGTIGRLRNQEATSRVIRFYTSGRMLLYRCIWIHETQFQLNAFGWLPAYHVQLADQADKLLALGTDAMHSLNLEMNPRPLTPAR